MALVTTLMHGCYIDGTCEVSAVYNDVTHLLKEIIVKGDLDREVDITVAGETVEIGRHNLKKLKFDLSKRKLRFFLPEDDTSEPEIPPITCIWYAQKLSRADINTDKQIAASK